MVTSKCLDPVIGKRLLFAFVACTACVEPISSSSHQEESAINLEAKSKSLQGSSNRMSFSFSQKTALTDGLTREARQEGLLRSAFEQNGQFQMCGGLLESKHVRGDAPALEGVPSGMVRQQKINQTKVTLAIRGYSGSWRAEGAWMVGSVDKISPKGRCDGAFKPFSGGRFWCYRLSSAPLSQVVLCGFERPPIRSDWQTSLSPLSLQANMSLPSEIQDRHLHWMVMGSPEGLEWEWTPDRGGEQHQFVGQAVEFNLDRLRAKAK